MYSVVVCHQDAPVGMGRVIGDGGCFFVITDIAVLPQHHKKGVGDRIMTALMAWIARHAPPSAYISLIASHGSRVFMPVMVSNRHCCQNVRACFCESRDKDEKGDISVPLLSGQFQNDHAQQ
nr:GNAT family N-acetyltransferase [Pantoea ananatis]